MSLLFANCDVIVILNLSEYWENTGCVFVTRPNNLLREGSVRWEGRKKSLPIICLNLISKWCEYSLTPSSSDKSWQVIELVQPRPEEEQLSVGVELAKSSKQNINFVGESASNIVNNVRHVVEHKSLIWRLKRQDWLGVLSCLPSHHGGWEAIFEDKYCLKSFAFLTVELVYKDCIFQNFSLDPITNVSFQKRVQW